MIPVYDSWASPYAPELFLVGDDSVLDTLSGHNGPELIEGVTIEVVTSGNKCYWRVAIGGDWVLVKVPGNLQLEGYPQPRQPVNGMQYLPVRPGEVFSGRMSVGKNRTRAFYSVQLTEKGVSLTPIEQDRWGDRAYDMTGSGEYAQKPVITPVSQPEDSGATPEIPAAGSDDESPLAAALRKAGLLP